MRMPVVPLVLLVALCAMAPGLHAQDNAAVYELRVYTCEPGKLDALHTRFRDHTMKLFAKHGIENVGYWTPADEPLSDNTLVYLLKHESREAAEASWEAFRNDPQWQQVAQDSREQHGKILSQAPESTFLALTDYSPQPGTPHRDSLFELRTYTASEGNLENLHARFRDHTDKLFQKHGIRPYAYWKPLDQPKSKNVMIYMIEHPNRELARAAWKAFGADPQWQAARQKSEEQGSLLVKQGVVSLYLEPTEYSPAR